MRPEQYDPDLPDYPASLLPFAEHPDYLEAPDETKRLVLTLAWLSWNERVIAAEEFVANPTFEMLAHGVFPGVETPEARETIQQSHIDEVWHTYMHMIAMRRTREARELDSEPTYPHAITNRVLYAMESEASERWERDLLYLLWTAVGEISITTFLDLVAGDTTVQPRHALIARLHSRDEAAHGPVLFEVMQGVYAKLNRKQQELFVRALPKGIVAFGSEDWELWPLILESAGMAKAKEIVAYCRTLPGNALLVTDFTPVRRLVQELEIAEEVEFDFVTNQMTA